MTEDNTITTIAEVDYLIAETVAFWALQTDLKGKEAQTLLELTADQGYDAIRSTVEALRNHHFQVAYHDIAGQGGTPEKRLEAIERLPEDGLVGGISPLRINTEAPDVQRMLYKKYQDLLGERAEEEFLYEEWMRHKEEEFRFPFH